MPELLAPNELTRAEWVARISADWRGSVEAIIRVGRDLVLAKGQLAHGEFEAMVENDLPFGRNTAHRLRAIAKDHRLTNVAHAPLLPSARDTLYELTKLDDDEFDHRSVFELQSSAAKVLSAELARRTVEIESAPKTTN